METFKARLVAKGYIQKEGINYDESFSLVVMFKPIWSLLPIAAALDYEIWQMDIKTAFFNENLDERIYMQFRMDKKERFANCKSPFMDLSKRPPRGISDSTRQ